jgi:transaldolase
MNRLQRLHDAGVSIWLDTLSRDLLDSGAFAELVRDDAVTGATSNPTIFAKAILGSDSYDEQLRAAVTAGVRDPQALFFALGLEDIRRAAEVLRPVYEASARSDGFVSFECTPDVADDTPATIAQALELWERLHLPNVLIKVPATAAGVPAIQELTARGVNVNVTLLFSIERYEQVIEAYLAGLERRVDQGEPIDQLRSVASFFVSRVDTKADAQLEAGSPLRGGWRSPTPRLPTRATGPGPATSGGLGWRGRGPARSARCGPAPGPKTQPSPTSSTLSG